MGGDVMTSAIALYLPRNRHARLNSIQSMESINHEKSERKNLSP